MKVWKIPVSCGCALLPIPAGLQALFFELLSPKDREVVWMGSEEPTCLSWVQIMSWNKPELEKLSFFSRWLFPQEPDPKAVGLCKW